MYSSAVQLMSEYTQPYINAYACVLHYTLCYMYAPALNIQKVQLIDDLRQFKYSMKWSLHYHLFIMCLSPFKTISVGMLCKIFKEQESAISDIDRSHVKYEQVF